MVQFSLQSRTHDITYTEHVEVIEVIDVGTMIDVDEEARTAVSGENVEMMVVTTGVKEEA